MCKFLKVLGIVLLCMIFAIPAAMLAFCVTLLFALMQIVVAVYEAIDNYK